MYTIVGPLLGLGFWKKKTVISLIADDSFTDFSFVRTDDGKLCDPDLSVCFSSVGRIFSFLDSIGKHRKKEVLMSHKRHIHRFLSHMSTLAKEETN